VQEKSTRALRDQQQGLQIVGERQTVGQFMEHWLDQVAANKVRPSTLESYRWITAKHIIPNLGRVPLAKLSPQQIQVFLNDRLKSGRQPLPKRLKEGKELPPPQPPSNPALTPRTVQHIHATLRTALDQALRRNLVGRNAATRVDAPRVRQTEVQPYTPEDAKKLLDELKDDRLSALYSAALAVGLRQGEALGLRWPDLDLDAGTLAVRNSLQRIDGKLQIVEVKTQKSRRTITLPKVAVDALLEHRARREQERQLAGTRWQEGTFVFTTSIGTPLEGSTVTHRFQAALKTAGLRRIRFHDLRHSCATLLLAQGVHPRVDHGDSRALADRREDEPLRARDSGDAEGSGGSDGRNPCPAARRQGNNCCQNCCQIAGRCRQLARKYLRNLVGPVGFEPTTNGL